MRLPPGRARAFLRQENRAVIAWREAASAGLVSSADRAYMELPSLARLRDKMGLLTKSPFEKLRRFIPAYLTKILVNPQRIACVFCFICRKNRSCFLHGFVCQQPQNVPNLWAHPRKSRRIILSKSKWAGSHFRAFPP